MYDNNNDNNNNSCNAYTDICIVQFQQPRMNWEHHQPW